MSKDEWRTTAAIAGGGPSARHEIYDLAGSTLGAVRIDDYKYRLLRTKRAWGLITQADDNARPMMLPERRFSPGRTPFWVRY